MYSHTNNSGFSLVETLVAITILLIVITGPLTLVSNSARSTNFANDQVIAYFLAQEGLEIAQAARDDLLIPTFDTGYSGGVAWDIFANTSGTYQQCFSGGCGLYLISNDSGGDNDPNGAVDVVNCVSTNVTNCQLHITSNNDERAKYTHEVTTDTEPSKYTRVITMNETDPGQIEVVSRVSWRSDGQRNIQNVETVTYLFDVYGR